MTYRIRGAAIAATVLGALPAAARAQGAAPDTSITVTLAGFVDGYYAYDFNRPSTFDRAFTTQPARANEFNVNLGYLEIVLGGGRLRGRLALQAGTSVQSNYAGEPANGSVAGPSLARHLQEAFVGYQLSPTIWVDAGIFYSNMGMESWVSRDNPTYTRSLVADYSPYYSSGAKITWQMTPRLSARLDVVNGWQNISETNTDKSVGARLDFALTPTAVVSYYGFLGNEIEARLRVFNGVGFKSSLTERVQVLGQVDVGSQQRGDDEDGSASWYGFTAIARAQVTPVVALSGRIERFDDEEQVLIESEAGTPGFRVNGASLGIDIVPRPRVLWRTELRGFDGPNRIFPDHDPHAALSKRNAFVVTSLALTF